MRQRVGRVEWSISLILAWRPASFWTATAIGIGLGLANNLVGDVESVTSFEHAVVIETKAENWGGYTLGNVITVNNDPSTGLKAHEFGHVLQSEIVGLGYLPGIALPSLISATADALQGTNDHPQFWTETTADALSQSYFQNQSNEDEDDD